MNLLKVIIVSAVLVSTAHSQTIKSTQGDIFQIIPDSVKTVHIGKGQTTTAYINYINVVKGYDVVVKYAVGGCRSGKGMSSYQYLPTGNWSEDKKWSTQGSTTVDELNKTICEVAARIR